MSIKPSVLSQITLDILQAPEGEVFRSYTSTGEDSNIENVNQIRNPENVDQMTAPEYVNA